MMNLKKRWRVVAIGVLVVAGMLALQVTGRAFFQGTDDSRGALAAYEPSPAYPYGRPNPAAPPELREKALLDWQTWWMLNKGKLRYDTASRRLVASL